MKETKRPRSSPSTGATRRRKRPARTAEPRPAPGDLAILQAFLNTGRPEKTADALAKPRKLGRWLARRGLLDAGIELGEDELRRALDVRAGLRAMLAAHRGGSLDARAVARLEPAAGSARLVLRFEEDGGPAGFRAASSGFDDALGALLAIAAAARLEGQWPLFKLCGRPECGRAFFDESPSRTGKWCNTRCGERFRAAAYRRTEWYKAVFKRQR